MVEYRKAGGGKTLEGKEADHPLYPHSQKIIRCLIMLNGESEMLKNAWHFAD